MSSSGTSLLAEADLHGLVDGHIPPDRRVEALRHIAASPDDRARVEAWQGQNDLLRSTFTAIVREPLPSMLDLKAEPTLQSVAANDAPIIEFPRAVPIPPRRGKRGTVVATLAVIAAGLCGSWVLLNEAQTEAVVSAVQLRGPLDVALAARSNEAARQTPGEASPASRPGESLPTTDIPDLRAAGFSFTGADTSATRPISISFRYRNDKAERVAVSVAVRDPADKTTTAAPVPIGDAYAWHKGDKAYAIAGTLRPAKLRSLALTLISDDTQ